MSGGWSCLRCGATSPFLLPPSCNGGQRSLVVALQHSQQLQRNSALPFNLPISTTLSTHMKNRRWGFYRVFKPLPRIRPCANSDHIAEYPLLRRFDAEYPSDENLFLASWKFMISLMKEVAIFLKEQPEQIKYIEWPSFKETVKLAVSTLVIVILLTIFLTAVDSSFTLLFSRGISHHL